jgi:hypothetical protein
MMNMMMDDEHKKIIDDDAVDDYEGVKGRQFQLFQVPGGTSPPPHLGST